MCVWVSVCCTFVLLYLWGQLWHHGCKISFYRRQQSVQLQSSMSQNCLECRQTLLFQGENVFLTEYKGHCENENNKRSYVSRTGHFFKMIKFLSLPNVGTIKNKKRLLCVVITPDKVVCLASCLPSWAWLNLSFFERLLRKNCLFSRSIITRSYCPSLGMQLTAISNYFNLLQYFPPKIQYRFTSWPVGVTVDVFSVHAELSCFFFFF